MFVNFVTSYEQYATECIRLTCLKAQERLNTQHKITAIYFLNEIMSVNVC